MPSDDQPTRFVLVHSTLPGFEGYPYWIPAEDEVAPDTPANASDPWAAFPDAPPMQAPTNGNGSFAIFSEDQSALANTSDPWAAFPDWPPAQGLSTTIGSGDPWSAFPDWPPAQAQFGDINPFAGFPDTPWSVPTSPAPGNAPWWVNGLPPIGALFSAPNSFGDAALPQASGDPWAAFPDWPPAGMQQQSLAAGPTGTLSATNFYAPVGNDAVNSLNLPASVAAAAPAARGNSSGTNAPYGPLQTGLNALGYAFQHSADPDLADAENLRYLVENHPEIAKISGGAGIAMLFGIPAAFALPEILEGALVKGAAISPLLEKMLAARIRKYLQRHVVIARTRFEKEGFTPAQLWRLRTNPELEPLFEGERTDTFIKDSLRPALKYGLQITERFEFGPDVFHPATRTWYDVTTRGQWARHIGKYTSGFGKGTPLFYGP